MFSSLTPFPNQRMTVEGMLRVISEIDPNLRPVSESKYNFAWQGVPLILAFAANYDRMRILARIKSIEELRPGELERAMEANFLSALDTRYAFHDGGIWSVFLHPISSLTPDLLNSAAEQVALAQGTFGVEYSSGEFALEW